MRASFCRTDMCGLMPIMSLMNRHVHPRLVPLINSARRSHLSPPKICGACGYPSATGDFLHRKELCEFPKVLGGCGEAEFIAGAARAPQSETAEARDALQMREEHRHLFPELAGDHIVGGLGDCTCPIPGRLEDRPKNLRSGFLRATA